MSCLADNLSFSRQESDWSLMKFFSPDKYFVWKVVNMNCMAAGALMDFANSAEFTQPLQPFYRLLKHTVRSVQRL